MNAEIQWIRTPKGEELVILTKAAYQRLLRDAGESVAEETIPADMAFRMAKGENPVLVWREYRKLTAEALAKKAGLSRAYVTQIETGARKGSARSLQALARALKVEIEDLLPRQD
ncbi:helix-turn-helix transcriptional regulator [Ferrovibrio sp.]|uniref:helix-turn-helix domain-containing protein n=1 Tax=Ferrovibrio sp. TaxID=1917215 RepID=UPI001B6EB71F|nr:helix-turn-helix transcriptional regulator [Ferrovibrio sp.]MBP7063802.1 helix-turn-helix transcriptional regulator [Ferrovibrio sp.]